MNMRFAHVTSSPVPRVILVTLACAMVVTLHTPNIHAQGRSEDEVRPLLIGEREAARSEVDMQGTCQPSGSLLPSKFKNVKVHKVSQDGLARRVSPKHLPKLKGFEVKGLQIDCMPDEDFPGETPPSYVFEISKAGKRVALFTHVTGLYPAPDGEVFLLENYLKRKKWEHRLRLVNLNLQPKRRQKTFIAASRCDRFGGWSLSGDHFVMYRLEDDPSEICVYDLKGALLYRWRVPLMHFGAGGELQSHSALILRKDVLIHLGDEPGPGSCRVDLIELSTQQVASKVFEQEECDFKRLRALFLDKNPSFSALKEAL